MDVFQLPRNDEWRDIDEFPDWAIDAEGNVLNNWTSNIISQRLNKQNLLMVNIHIRGKIHTRMVALLVARAFLEPPPNASYNSIIHLNGDRSDCRAMNLMWRPRWYALQYHKMFEEEPIRVAVLIPHIDKVFHSLREFCTTYGVIEKKTYIQMINGEPCFHYGWLVERYEE